jgi:hypothetical protein
MDFSDRALHVLTFYIMYVVVRRFNKQFRLIFYFNVFPQQLHEIITE